MSISSSPVQATSCRRILFLFLPDLSLFHVPLLPLCRVEKLASFFHKSFAPHVFQMNKNSFPFFVGVTERFKPRENYLNVCSFYKEQHALILQNQQRKRNNKIAIGENRLPSSEGFCSRATFFMGSYLVVADTCE